MILLFQVRVRKADDIYIYIYTDIHLLFLMFTQSFLPKGPSASHELAGVGFLDY